MMHKNPFFIVTCPSTKELRTPVTLDDLYLRFLNGKRAVPITTGLYAVGYEIDYLRLIEVKGTTDTLTSFELLHEQQTFWLVYQFLGHTSMPLLSASNKWQSGQYNGFVSRGESTLVQVDRGKNRLLFIGITHNAVDQLKEEFPLLFQIQSSHPTPTSLTIGYREKRLLEKVQQLHTTPYTFAIKLHHLICLLIEQYQQQVQSAMRSTLAGDLALYHQAVAYIQKNFLDPELNRSHIANALNVSLSTLNRAFTGRNKSISGSIQLIRLYKARELLQTTAQNIEDIAFQLYFTDRKYFTKTYKAHFNCTPNEERLKSQNKK